MFIELVDALRCPEDHEESWLVLASQRIVARHILEGTLGCPVCRAEYPIHDGVLDFTRGGKPHVAAAVTPAAQEAMRLAAFLGLDDALGFAVLLGGWGSQALELRALVECPIVLVDPPADVEAAPGLSIIRTAGPVPIAPASARAVAIDARDLHGTHGARVESAVRATKAKGRVLGHAELPLPAGVTQLARDAELWVGEREAVASPPVTLHVRRASRGA